MIRGLLFLAVCGAVTSPIWADHTDCALVSPGPIVSKRPEQPFVRKPDEAAIHNAYGSTIDDSYPPLRFQGDGEAWVHFVNPSRVTEVCGEKPDPRYPLEACQQGNVIVLPNPNMVSAALFKRLTSHELGHRNGWGGHHPL